MAIAIAVVSGVLGLSIIAITCTLILLKHRHDPEPVAVRSNAGPLFAAVPGLCSTIVLYRCRCGEASTRMFAGTWTLADITGEDDIPANHITGKMEVLLWSSAIETRH